MSVCVRCSVVNPHDAHYCTNCGGQLGAAGYPAPAYSTAPSATDDKSGLATAGLVCGIVSFLFLPIVLGPLGIVFGAISWKAGNQRGLAALVISVIGLPVGMLLGILAFS